MKPFLKWLGGKTRIADKITASLPKNKTLVEPFVGSGAIFVNANYKNYILSDINPDLIYMYRELQRSGEDFIRRAKKLFADKYNTSESYYKLREEFNASTSKKRRAVLFLYLNRHGFNGLCRYNNKGKYNVAYGKYKKPYFPEVELLHFYEKSKNAKFILGDFRYALSKVPKNSTVYCDPPYSPIKSNSFTHYNGQTFGHEDHKDLVRLVRKLSKVGIPSVISNSNTEMTRKLYRKADLSTDFSVNRNISGKICTRAKAKEIIVTYNSKIKNEKGI